MIEVIIVCLVVGVALFLFLLPACFSADSSEPTALFGRIEVEQHHLFQSSFEREQRSLPGLKKLQANQGLMDKLCRWASMDQKKTGLILSRLRWNISIEELLLAKLATAIFLVASVGFALVRIYASHAVEKSDLLPGLICLVGFILPGLLLEWADKRVKSEIREQIPVFFSIVQALVEAGMPIQAAVKNTARRSQSRLGQELAQLEVLEKRFGNWRKALEEMAYRWDVDAFISIALEINEAITKGVSIAGTLAVQIEEQLKQQEDEAAEYMNKLTIRLLPFVILLMGVPLLYLVMGPAFLGIKERL